MSFHRRLTLSESQRADVLGRNNLDDGRMEDEDDLIPLSDFVGAMEDLGRITKDPMLGWRLGETIDMADLGETGLALSLAPTLGDALTCLGDSFATIQTSTYLRFQVEGDVATIKYAVLDPTIWPRQQDAELTLGLIAGLVRRFAGEDSQDSLTVELEHDRTAGTRALASHLRRGIHHGAALNSLSFPVALLNQRQTDGPTTDFQAISRHLERNTQAVVTAQPLSARVRLLLFQGMDDGAVDQETIAKALGMSPRGLRRHLVEDEGKTFQDIVDDTRKALASAYLTRTRLSLGEIALHLGYSDQTAFTRAFTRWFGASPRSVRRGARESMSTT
ncbi:MAG: AraC family transcriptional regulator [Rhodospirillum sp.]|nr:AraC family transcriptional regulator [Rhodospirillum sp.]MCF8490752.1 AraC family transcriptional regulator [Rhodospirillum sp.]